MENGKNTLLPELDGIRNELVYRLLGDARGQERFGMGFMNKSGIAVDNRDLEFPDYVLVYVLRGRGVFEDGITGNATELHPGMYFQRLPGRRHSNYIDPDSGWMEMFIDLGPELYRTFSRLRCIRPEPLCRNIGLDTELAEKLWHLKECLKHESRRPEQVLGGMLELLFQIHARDEAHGDSASGMVERGREYLGRDFSRRLNLREFCQRNGWGYESFRKQFTRETGMPPNQYRIRRRIDAAIAMLGQRDIGIAGIAWKLGYASQFEFSTQFKKHTGYSPSHFIRKN